MSGDILKTLLASLNKNAFKAFAVDFLGSLINLPKIGNDVYYEGLIDSYGGNTIHAVYLFHHFPVDLIKDIQKVNFDEPDLARQLKGISEEYRGAVGYWGMVSESLVEDQKLHAFTFITNLTGYAREVYDKSIVPKYEHLIRGADILPKTLLVGSCDSFVDLNEHDTREAFEKFLTGHKDGLTISLAGDGAQVNSFRLDSPLTCGILPHSGVPCESTSTRTRECSLVAELEYLLNKNSTEGEIEKFIAANYQDLFGFRYDRIETQLWLRFPELDISHKSRRLDIFLRNAVDRDWELFEIKRPINLTSSYRDVPVLAREVHAAIQQLRNYHAVITQDSVRRRLAQDGIEYFSPSLRLVIGRDPELPHKQWRWLKKSNEENLKIITYDDLLREMRCRMDMHRKFANEEGP